MGSEEAARVAEGEAVDGHERPGPVRNHQLFGLAVYPENDRDTPVSPGLEEARHHENSYRGIYLYCTCRRWL